MTLDYVRLKDISEEQVKYLLSMYEMPQISRFISIDRERYFSYVTKTVLPMAAIPLILRVWRPVAANGWWGII